jgi:hypothetical protein
LNSAVLEKLDQEKEIKLVINDFNFAMSKKSENFEDFGCQWE